MIFFFFDFFDPAIGLGLDSRVMMGMNRGAGNVLWHLLFFLHLWQDSIPIFAWFSFCNWLVFGLYAFWPVGNLLFLFLLLVIRSEVSVWMSCSSRALWT